MAGVWDGFTGANGIQPEHSITKEAHEELKVALLILIHEITMSLSKTSRLSSVLR